MSVSAASREPPPPTSNDLEGSFRALVLASGARDYFRARRAIALWRAALHLSVRSRALHALAAQHSASLTHRRVRVALRTVSSLLAARATLASITNHNTILYRLRQWRIAAQRAAAVRRIATVFATVSSRYATVSHLRTWRHVALLLRLWHNATQRAHGAALRDRYASHLRSSTLRTITVAAARRFAQRRAIVSLRSHAAQLRTTLAVTVASRRARMKRAVATWCGVVRAVSLRRSHMHVAEMHAKRVTVGNGVRSWAANVKRLQRAETALNGRIAATVSANVMKRATVALHIVAAAVKRLETVAQLRIRIKQWRNVVTVAKRRETVDRFATLFSRFRLLSGTFTLWRSFHTCATGDRFAKRSRLTRTLSTWRKRVEMARNGRTVAFHVMRNVLRTTLTAWRTATGAETVDETVAANVYLKRFLNRWRWAATVSATVSQRQRQRETALKTVALRHWMKRLAQREALHGATVSIVSNSARRSLRHWRNAMRMKRLAVQVAKRSAVSRAFRALVHVAKRSNETVATGEALRQRLAVSVRQRCVALWRSALAAKRSLALRSFLSTWRRETAGKKRLKRLHVSLFASRCQRALNAWKRSQASSRAVTVAVSSFVSRCATGVCQRAFNAWRRYVNGRTTLRETVMKRALGDRDRLRATVSLLHVDSSALGSSCDPYAGVVRQLEAVQVVSRALGGATGELEVKEQRGAVTVAQRLPPVKRLTAPRPWRDELEPQPLQVQVQPTSTPTAITSTPTVPTSTVEPTSAAVQVVLQGWEQFKSAVTAAVSAVQALDARMAAVSSLLQARLEADGSGSGDDDWLQALRAALEALHVERGKAVQVELELRSEFDAARPRLQALGTLVEGGIAVPVALLQAARGGIPQRMMSNATRG